MVEREELSDVKKEYLVLSEKHSLPRWKELEEEFEVSRVFYEHSELILREIRRKMNERLVSYLHLFEHFLNPSGAPLFVLNAIKNIDEKEREEVKEIYKKFSQIQFLHMSADTLYSEEKEVETIKKSFVLWNENKLKISKIINSLGKKYEVGKAKEKTGYLG